MANNAGITIRINGYPYMLKGEGSVEDLQKIADLVNEKIETIREQFPTYSANKLAIMTALQLAEELVRLQRDYDLLVTETEIVLQE